MPGATTLYCRPDAVVVTPWRRALRVRKSSPWRASAKAETIASAMPIHSQTR